MPSGGFTERSKVLRKNAWPGHYPKGSEVQQDPVGHYQLGQKNTVYLEMIYLGVKCMYFHAKPLQNQCILELVHYTK